MNLLITKFYRPPLPPHHIHRPALLEKLQVSWHHKLTLVAAGAGFGKTSLLAEWSQHQTHPIAWLALDPLENDPLRFMAYMVGAIQIHHPQWGQELFFALNTLQPPPLDHLMYSYLNQLAELPAPLMLLWDDYHVIENPVIHAAVTVFIDFLPPQIHLILASRIDPPFPLAKWRAKGYLGELRTVDLRFSLEETTAFFQQQLPLEDATIEALEQRTEGWVAGLHLAALALQHHTPERFIPQFTGSHRYILDYLMSEVLAQQPSEIRQFLLQTAILDRFNAALCTALTGHPTSQKVLDYLESHHLFVIPLDTTRTWYRYHHLFGDMLRAYLQADYPAQLPHLHARAARSYAEQGFPLEAIPHALTAQDFELAAHLILNQAVVAMPRAESVTLLQWYTAFPADFLRTQPRLALHFGLGLALNGQWQPAEQLLNEIETDATLPPYETLLLTYLVANYRQDAHRLAHIATQAIHSADRQAKVMGGLLLAAQGDFSRANHLLAESQSLSEQTHDSELTLTTRLHRCRLMVYAGELHAAANLCQQTLQFLDQNNPMASLAYLALGRIQLEWLDLDQAETYLQAGITWGKKSGLITGVLSSGTMMLAEIAHARGEPEQALALAEQALQLARQYDPPHEVQWLNIYQVRIWLQQGKRAKVEEWLKSLPSLAFPPSMFYPPAILTATHARALLMIRRLGEAIPLLTAALNDTPPHLLTCELLATLALAREPIQAEIILTQALEQATRENRQKVFTELGQPMAILLEKFCQTHPEHEFAHALLPKMDASKQAETFSERELAVLRLVVAGYSNEEIAQTLVIALSTVKWYINNLYSKLGVKTRAQAIARARSMHL